MNQQESNYESPEKKEVDNNQIKSVQYLKTSYFSWSKIIYLGLIILIIGVLASSQYEYINNKEEVSPDVSKETDILEDYDRIISVEEYTNAINKLKDANFNSLSIRKYGANNNLEKLFIFQNIKIENGKANFYACQEEVNNTSSPYTYYFKFNNKNCSNQANISLALNNISYLEDTDGSYIGILSIFVNGFELEKRLAFFTLYDSGGILPYIGADMIHYDNILDIKRKQNEIFLVKVVNNGKEKNLYFYANPNDLREISSDGEYFKYKDLNLGFSFNYPRVIASDYTNQYAHTNYSFRSFDAEKILNISPIYYKESCGMDNTLADQKISLSYGKNNYSSYNTGFTIDFSAHKLNYNNVYLTTARYGYDPLEWNAIKESLNIDDYVYAINNGEKISDRDVEFLNINNQPVRHIKPYSIGRPCANRIMEAYQWVNDGFIFSIVVYNNENVIIPTNFKEKILGEIISSAGKI